MSDTIAVAIDADSAMPLRRRSRITLWTGVACLVLAIVIGDAIDPLVPTILFVLGGAALIYLVVLKSRLRHELARQAAANSPLPEKLSWRTYAGIVISRGLLAVILASVHDPLVIAFLGFLCVVGLLGAVIWRTQAVTWRAQLIKAVIYGMAAVYAYGALMNDRANADILVAKLAEYKLQHGSYPEKLDALVPALLPEIPTAGFVGFKYVRDQDAYRLYYRPSVAGPCFNSPTIKGWKCTAD
ncbi:MAG: hypothetical protein M0Q22_09875 [Sulfuritalea sp.]|jgi:hypothetical protein|nr:hypothetical protein [Sulfuritalea sp.]